MIFTTIERYDKELEDMELELKETEEYLKNHPEKQGTKGNYETMKYLYNLYKENKIEFIKEMNNFNLKLYGIPETLPINSVYKLNKKVNNITNSLTSILDNNLPRGITSKKYFTRFLQNHICISKSDKGRCEKNILPQEGTDENLRFHKLW